MKNLINQIGGWTIKYHWIFLLVIFGTQWLTGEIMSESEKWGWLLNPRLARQIHSLNGKMVLAALVFMAANKFWLVLKRREKI